MINNRRATSIRFAESLLPSIPMGSANIPINGSPKPSSQKFELRTAALATGT